MLYFLKNKIFLNQQLSLALRDHLWPWVWGGPGHRPTPPHHTHTQCRRGLWSCWVEPQPTWLQVCGRAVSCVHMQASLSAHWPPLEYLGYLSCPKWPRFLVPGTLGGSPLDLGFSSSQNFIFCL